MDKSGDYLGTVVGDRLLRRQSQRYRGYPGYPGCPGYPGYPGYARPDAPPAAGMPVGSGC